MCVVSVLQAFWDQPLLSFDQLYDTGSAKATRRWTARLRRGRQALDDIAENVYNDAQLPNGYNWKKITRQPLDIQIRVLQKLLIHYGGTTRPYPPKLERVEDIVTGLKAGQSATLYGCILSLSKDGNTLEIKRTTA